MPSLYEWEQALATPREVTVESSETLLEEIRQRHIRKDAKRLGKNQPIPPRKANLQVVQAFSPNLRIQVAPLAVLHRLGVVTTPAITNLVDICSTWAYFRYLWAFEPPRPGTAVSKLKLSEAARKIDFHQKGLLSDQIGVGMAALLLGTYLDAPLAADVSVAMEDDDWPIDLQYDSSPDYLFSNTTQTNLYVVECKGTQKARASSLEQLRRGTEQVPSLIFNDGREPPSIVVATCLAKSGTRILILDPPGESESNKHPIEKARRTGEREWRPRNDEQFANASRQLSEAKILSFAGDETAANLKRERAKAPSSRTPQQYSRASQTSVNEFGTFRGVRQNIEQNGELAIEVFQGLDTQVYAALVDEDSSRTSEEIDRFRRRVEDVTPNSRIGDVAIDRSKPDAISVQSIAPDGTVLEVNITRQ